MKKMRVKQRGKDQKRKNRTESEPRECACVCVLAYRHICAMHVQQCSMLKLLGFLYTNTIQCNVIAKCQYTDCTRTVLWCQVHSSHINSSHKTFLIQM